MQKVRNTAARHILNQCRKSGIPLHAIFSEHQAIKTAHLSYSNFNGSQFLNESNAKLLACITTPLMFVTHCTFTALPAVSVFIKHIHVKTQRLNHKTAGFRSFSQGIRHSATLSSDKVAVGASKTSSSDTWWRCVHPDHGGAWKKLSVTVTTSKFATKSTVRF